MGAVVKNQYTSRYPNGQPLSTLSGYQAAPDLTSYTNGQPLQNPSGSGVSKNQIVVMALQSAMAAKGGQKSGQKSSQRGRACLRMKSPRRRGMRGLGDDGGVDYESGTITGSPDDSGTYYDSGTIVNDPWTGATTSPASATSSVMSTIAGAPSYATTSTSGIGNSLTNLFSGIANALRGTPTYGYTTVSPFSQPLVAGSTVSTGSILLLGGGALLLVLLMKKR